MMNGAKAYAKVGLETGINSASPHGLIVLLYDGAIDSIRKAKIYMEAKDIEMKIKSVDKALKIISDGLNGSLDVEPSCHWQHNFQPLVVFRRCLLVPCWMYMSSRETAVSSFSWPTIDLSSRY